MARRATRQYIGGHETPHGRGARHNYCCPTADGGAAGHGHPFNHSRTTRTTRRGNVMATSRKGSTTPKDLKDDAGGLVAGGGPDLSGTAMPSKPASAKAKAKPADGSAGRAVG